MMYQPERKAARRKVKQLGEAEREGWKVGRWTAGGRDRGGEGVEGRWGGGSEGRRT